jgi:adenosylmethionine-8-amino-7-oxononanoate aminotransferase
LTGSDEIGGIIVEPPVQGAGGMLFHDVDVLVRLRRLADRHQVLLIFDEIFTGFGRTGAMFASEAVAPDIVTLSKALTGGTLPLAATIARRAVFDAFWSDAPSHALMHGPTYMANPLACAAAPMPRSTCSSASPGYPRSPPSRPHCGRGSRSAARCGACAMCE